MGGGGVFAGLRIFGRGGLGLIFRGRFLFSIELGLFCRYLLFVYFRLLVDVVYVSG